MLNAFKTDRYITTIGGFGGFWAYKGHKRSSRSLKLFGMLRVSNDCETFGKVRVMTWTTEFIGVTKVGMIVRMIKTRYWGRENHLT